MLSFFRNKRLDKKDITKRETKLKQADITYTDSSEENNLLNYSNSLDEIINSQTTLSEKSNAVILMGSTFDRQIPVAELAKDYDFNFDIYNKSLENLSLSNSIEYFNHTIADLIPEGIIIHLGENDLNLFQSAPASFDSYYITLIDEIKHMNKNCRIALLSINNNEKNKNISCMNAHIRAIAETEKTVFVILDNAKLWNPKATKAASDFAYSMGLRIRKPLKDVAEILYSYAFHYLNKETENVLVS